MIYTNKIDRINVRPIVRLVWVYYAMGWIDDFAVKILLNTYIFYAVIPTVIGRLKIRANKYCPTRVAAAGAAFHMHVSASAGADKQYQQ